MIDKLPLGSAEAAQSISGEAAHRGRKVALSLSPEVHAEISARAEQHGLSLSGYIRMLIFMEIHKNPSATVNSQSNNT